MKKTVAIILALCVLLSAAPAVFAAEADDASLCLLGDVDGDGDVTASDARAILRFAVKLDEPKERQRLLADVDSSREINASDARAALRIAVKLDERKPHAQGREEKANEKKATCTAPGGYDLIVCCAVCGGQMRRSTVSTPSLGHEYEKTVKAPTCTEGGYTVNMCVRCGGSYTSDFINALGHDFDDTIEKNVAVTPPTCVENGEKSVKCSRCSEKEVTEIIAAGHSYVSETTEPTCEAAGFTKYTCAVCGDAYTENETPALGHDFGEWTETKAPTCEDDGEETRYCSRCDENETRILPALGHDFGEWAETKAPTCAEDGEETRYCIRCDETETKASPALGHDFGEWTETKAPTCTDEGEETRYCSRCDESETKALSALGHDAEEGEMSVDGDTVCSRCGKTVAPSFNTLVNSLKTSDLRFSTITKRVSSGADTSCEIDIPEDIGDIILQGYTVDEIKEMYKAPFVDERSGYYSLYSNQLIKETPAFPVPNAPFVSALTSEDVVDLSVTENMDSVDFLDELPQQVTIDAGGAYYDADLTYFKALAQTQKPVTKITVTIKPEAYSEFKDSTEETALMRITGQDVRAIFAGSNASASSGGYTYGMSCTDLTTDCVVSFWFSVETDESGEKSYTPIAAKYETSAVSDRHVDVTLSLEGIEGVMKCGIDTVFSDVLTNYFIFTAD
ncbi:MAG: dockerin type I repeat-containing protein [Clostridia bacterium]|nr:dockerin type I repeat-containing protein [Clostridia bacterium]